jgi:hypothetical protein
MLGPHVFVALSAIVWADGNVTADERAALLNAARAVGLAGADLDSIESSTRERGEIPSLDASTLTLEERQLVYGFGCWLMRTDGSENHAEWASIGRLGHALTLSEEQREVASATSFAIEEILAKGPDENSLAAILRALAKHSA